MKIVILNSRYLIIRHWFRWYVVSNPYKNKMTWTPLKQSWINTTDKP